MAFSNAMMEQVARALSADIVSLGVSVVGLGVVSHVSIFRILPVEEYLFGILGLALGAVLAICLAYLFVTGLSTLQVLTRVTLIVFSFNVGLVSSIGIYRLFFHRVRRFPGPVLSKLSRFYDAYLAGKDVQYNVEIEKLHETYGDFIRTALATYEPRVKAKADQLASHIEKNIDQPIDASAWSMFLSFDIMGAVGFGKEFNNLETGVEHPAIKGVHDHMAILGTLGHVPWFLNLASRIPGAASGYSSFFKWCEDEIERKQKVQSSSQFAWSVDETPQDVVSWLLKAYVEKDASAAPSEAALHEDSRVVIVAGSETTATTLASVLYYLAKNPATLAKLQRLLDDAMPAGVEDWSYEKVKSVAYLDDVIQETLRLRPAVMTGGYRVTPTEGITVDEVYIPGDVNVFVPVQLIQTDERYYTNAKEFVPERWSEKRDMFVEGAPFFPFVLGPYSCPGKNLAMMSLRISLSTLLQSFNIQFAPGESGENFEKKTLDTFTTTLPSFKVQFQLRQTRD
ncbi:uncharacterized protein N7506_001945 [Penicillium brevicompactum]|uniref:uncharacterized protein n=1 Tax=Penicillium brevicompactum TaxID=5074 RepID=UPI00253FD4A5|nr:uncharacterized protein N7506_001945 [Penicillium brevicompactum]KAJ5348692.1 hypothetical protein N7506_001945 [Penicillium brevicompactum]